MKGTVPAKHRVHRILKGSRSFLPSTLRLGRPLPKGIVLSPGEELVGGIWGSRLESILTDCGAYFRIRSGWKFIAYGEIEDVCFPDKSDPDGSLTLRTPLGSVEVLKGRPELWKVGRFFMRCRADANEA
jgi:hypothetical protein